MKHNQFSIYRVDLNTDGYKIRGHSYDYVRERHLQLSSENYKQVYFDQLNGNESVRALLKRIREAKGNPVLDSVGTSDVLVVNRDGEIRCYYIDHERLIPLTSFIPVNTDGAVIHMDTKEYEIKGKNGSWDVTDSILFDGKLYYLMEHHQFRASADGVIIDAYGRIISDEVTNGFDEDMKQKIRDSMNQAQQVRVAAEANNQNKAMSAEVAAIHVGTLERLTLWQKPFVNGAWERQRESGTEANYDMVDGRVNNQPKEEVEKSENPVQKNKQKKRTSVLAKLRNNQIKLAKESGKPIPMYLQQMERNRK